MSIEEPGSSCKAVGQEEAAQWVIVILVADVAGSSP